MVKKLFLILSIVALTFSLFGQDKTVKLGSTQWSFYSNSYSTGDTVAGAGDTYIINIAVNKGIDYVYDLAIALDSAGDGSDVTVELQKSRDGVNYVYADSVVWAMTSSDSTITFSTTTASFTETNASHTEIHSGSAENGAYSWLAGDADTIFYDDTVTITAQTVTYTDTVTVAAQTTTVSNSMFIWPHLRIRLKTYDAGAKATVDWFSGMFAIKND